MASNSRVVKRIRKAKKTAMGQQRKREVARAHRIQSEKKLEAALGEHISLPTIR
jgi:ribosomal protein L29